MKEIAIHVQYKLFVFILKLTIVVHCIVTNEQLLTLIRHETVTEGMQFKLLQFSVQVVYCIMHYSLKYKYI